MTKQRMSRMTNIVFNQHQDHDKEGRDLRTTWRVRTRMGMARVINRRGDVDDDDDEDDDKQDEEKEDEDESD